MTSAQYQLTADRFRKLATTRGQGDRIARKAWAMLAVKFDVKAAAARAAGR